MSQLGCMRYVVQCTPIKEIYIIHVTILLTHSLFFITSLPRDHSYYPIASAYNSYQILQTLVARQQSTICKGIHSSIDIQTYHYYSHLKVGNAMDTDKWIHGQQLGHTRVFVIKFFYTWTWCYFILYSL